MNEELLKKCEEYVHIFWCCEDLKDGGMYALYGIEQHRIEVHDEICEILGIDHMKSKDIMSYLDQTIGLDLSEQPSNSQLKDYAVKLAELLISQKDKLS